MSRFSRFDLIEHSPFPPFESFLTSSKTLALSPYFPPFPMEDELDFTLDLLHPPPPPFDFPSRFDEFDVLTDLIQVEKTPFYTTSRRVQRRRVDRPGVFTDLYLQALSDRVSELELSLPKLVKDKKEKKEKKEKEEKKEKIGQRKYSWSAEIENPGTDGIDRKYKWTAEIKDGKKKGTLEKNFKYTTEIKGKDDSSPFTRTYTFKSSSGDAEDKSPEKEVKDKEKKDKKNKIKPAGSTRLIEIQDSPDRGALVLRQAYARRVAKAHGKRKELSAQDAALLIQMNFRAYLIRRSQALRALRDLAIAKSKLKEIRALFHNFSYRRQLSRDAEEHQKFTEKIIVLLLTVDAIVGADTMVRSAKKSMVDELEAMLDVVDPQPPGKSLNRRRTFDMPDAAIQKELAEGVAQVVRMLEEDHHASETSEA